LTPVPAGDIRRGDGDQVIEALEALCIITKDGFAGRAGAPLRLRDWQKTLLRHLFARRPDGRRRHRLALIGTPRKNGKSALALDGLLFDGAGAEVYSAAAEKEQARIVFGETRKMVAATPELAEACNAMRDVIEVPATGSIYRVLSAEAYSKEGLNISRAIVDELHAHPTDDLWNVLTLASAARIDPMVIAITTAGVMSQRDGKDTVCYRLWRHGRDVAEGLVDDPSFFMAWWGAPDGADYLDPDVWRAANPGFGDLIDPEDFASAVLRTPENEFRTKRLNQWVAASSAWLPAGAWEARYSPARLERGDTVVLGFDGSYSNDSTALVAAKCTDPPLVTVLRAWEKPSDAPPDWRVPIVDVEDEIRAACKRFQVREIVCDPFRWARSLQVLADEHLPVVEFPQSPQRMVPATQRFYEAVLNGGIVHDGNEILARHLRNCATKTSSRGTMVSKESKSSSRKIDAAVAAIMAFDAVAAAPKHTYGARTWLESLAPPCPECGQPNLPGTAVCSKCSVSLTPPDDPDPDVDVGDAGRPPPPPFVTAPAVASRQPPPSMLPQTAAAYRMLDLMRRGW
jgi:phage terminase large subunit-like protein